MGKYNKLTKPFVVISLAREDLERLGYDTSNISDTTMKELASLMGSHYRNHLFWEYLERSSSLMNIPKRKTITK
jgi:predicted HAD superfamily phosphohydrolase